MAQPTWFWMEHEREGTGSQLQSDGFLFRSNLKAQVKHYEIDLMETKLFGDKFGRNGCEPCLPNTAINSLRWRLRLHWRQRGWGIKESLTKGGHTQTSHGMASQMPLD